MATNARAIHTKRRQPLIEAWKMRWDKDCATREYYRKSNWLRSDEFIERPNSVFHANVPATHKV